MSLGSTASARRPDRAALVIALVLAALAAIIVWQTALMRVPPIQARVGPTVFPYAIAFGLAILSVCTAVSALRGQFPTRDRDEVAPMLWVIGGLLGQILLLSTLGFSIATGVLFACTAKGFGRGPLGLTVPVGTVFAFAIWFVFSHGLQLSLPTGPLERLVP